MNPPSDSSPQSAPRPVVAAGGFYEELTFESWSPSPTDLSRAEFIHCRFKNCRSAGVLLNGTTFESCQFIDCDFTNASLLDTRFIDCTFTGCKLLGWKWPDARSPVLVSLKNCLCAESSFFGLQLKKLKLTGCTLTNADFAEAKLLHADLRDSDFSGARFHNTDLSHADFSTARNYHIDARANIVTKAKFSLPEAVSLLEGLGITLV